MHRNRRSATDLIWYLVTGFIASLAVIGGVGLIPAVFILGIMKEVNGGGPLSGTTAWIVILGCILAMTILGMISSHRQEASDLPYS